MLCSWAEIKLFTRGNPPHGDFATSTGGGSCSQLRRGWELVVLDYHHGKGLSYSLWKILWLIENLRWNLMIHSFVQFLKYMYGLLFITTFYTLWYRARKPSRSFTGYIILIVSILHVHALKNTSAPLGFKFSHTKTQVIRLPSILKVFSIIVICKSLLYVNKQFSIV